MGSIGLLSSKLDSRFDTFEERIARQHQNLVLAETQRAKGEEGRLSAEMQTVRQQLDKNTEQLRQLRLGGRGVRAQTERRPPRAHSQDPFVPAAAPWVPRGWEGLRARRGVCGRVASRAPGEDGPEEYGHDGRCRTSRRWSRPAECVPALSS